MLSHTRAAVKKEKKTGPRGRQKRPRAAKKRRITKTGATFICDVLSHMKTLDFEDGEELFVKGVAVEEIYFIDRGEVIQLWPIQLWPM